MFNKQRKKCVLKIHKKTKAISYPLVKHIISKAKGPVKALLAFQYATAARAGELAFAYRHERKRYGYAKGKYFVKRKLKDYITKGMTVRDFMIVSAGISWIAPNFKNATKTEKRIYVYANSEPWLHKILVAWVKHRKRRNKKYLFDFGERRIRQLVDAELKKYDKSFHSHILRHSRGTHLAIITSNPFVVKENLGHSSLEVSQEYIHLTDKELRLQLAGKKFEDILGKEI